MPVRRPLAALAAVVLLAGCGGDPKPKVEPTPTSPTISPTESESAKPATAEDVIRQWARLLLRAQNTGDTTPLLDAFPSCRECRHFAGQIEKYYQDGGYIRAGAWHYDSIHEAGHVGSRYEYDFKLHAEPTAYRTSSDKPTRHLGGGEQGFRMFLKKTQAGWTVTNYEALTS